MSKLKGYGIFPLVERPQYRPHFTLFLFKECPQNPKMVRMFFAPPPSHILKTSLDAPGRNLEQKLQPCRKGPVITGPALYVLMSGVWMLDSHDSHDRLTFKNTMLPKKEWDYTLLWGSRI